MWSAINKWLIGKGSGRRFEKKVSGITLTILLTSLLTLAFNIHPAMTENSLEKILIFEESFESEIATWWNEIRGTPTFSTEKAHSGNYSYVIDEDEDGLIHWFDSNVINEKWEFEAWFYDSMSGSPVTSIIGTGWAPSAVLGALIWYGGDYDNFYAYRYGSDEILTTHARSVGWHRVNIIHESQNASIFLDGNLLAEINVPVSFNRFFIGDYWVYGTFSFTYYDDIKVWKYVPIFSVSITPLSSSIHIGDSLTFKSIITGGTPPYSYQWYLNETAVQGATSGSWVFTPTTSGIYNAYLKVTDAISNTTQSETAHINVRERQETEIETLEAIADAYVRSGSEENHGKDAVLQVDYLYGTMGIAFILFDLSSIPLWATIDSVMLKLKVEIFVPEWNRWVSVFSTSARWNETGINWNNKPNLKKMLAINKVDLIDEWYSWEHPYLTEAVEEALSRKENLSVALKSYYLSDLTGLITFYSRESGNGPKLEITYKDDITPPTISSLVMQPNSPTPNDMTTLSITVGDNISGVKEAYLYYSINSSSSWNKIPMIFTANSYKATIPKQAEGTTIHYYFEAFDNAYNRAQSDTYTYTVRYGVPLYLYLLPPLLILGVIAIFLTYYAKRKRVFSKAKTNFNLNVKKDLKKWEWI